MIADERLMRRLFRTTAFARRNFLSKENNGDEKQLPHFKKGFSNILEKLVRENGISQQQIADRIGIRPQSASEAICAMEERGLIRREVSEEDKRVMLIYLTEEGREYHEKSSQELKEHAKEFFSVLSEEEKQTLFSILAKLNRMDEKVKFSENESEECKCRQEK